METCEDFLAISPLADGFLKRSVAWCSHTELTLDVLKIFHGCKIVCAPPGAFGTRVLNVVHILHVLASSSTRWQVYNISWSTEAA